jgi:hypothetical protein
MGVGRPVRTTDLIRTVQEQIASATTMLVSARREVDQDRATGGTVLGRYGAATPTIEPTSDHWSLELPREREASGALFFDGLGRVLIVDPTYVEGWDYQCPLEVVGDEQDAHGPSVGQRRQFVPRTGPGFGIYSGQ